MRDESGASTAAATKTMRANRMKITMVAPGVYPIPPTGYGGIELVIWNIRKALIGEGHHVNIVNLMGGGNSIAKRWKIVRAINASRPDVVHIHASKYFNLARFIRCSNILFSDHSPGVSFEEYKYHRRAKVKGAHTLCFSEKIKEFYAAVGISCDFLHVIPNGVAVAEFSFTEQPKYPDRSICLGVVSKRKRQYAIADLPNIDFAGPVNEPVDFLDGAYQGEWSRQQVCRNLTEYANKVLLTEAEAHNVACMESLASGLGLVISQNATDNLDTSLPFIDVVPDDKIHDRGFVSGIIAKNRATALTMRKDIREYAKSNFDTDHVVKTKYLPLLLSIVL